MHCQRSTYITRFHACPAQAFIILREPDSITFGPHSQQEETYHMMNNLLFPFKLPHAILSDSIRSADENHAFILQDLPLFPQRLLPSTPTIPMQLQLTIQNSMSGNRENNLCILRNYISLLLLRMPSWRISHGASSCATAAIVTAGGGGE
jgi:hypothetical protein